MTTAISRMRIALDTTLLDDTLRGKVVGAIEKVAPQSTLFQVPAIAASYAALVAKYTTLTSNVTAVAGAEQLLKASVVARDASRVALDGELVTLKALVANSALTPSDITGMGFTVLSAAVSTRTQPDAPTLLIVKTGKAHGKATVTVHETGTTRGRYAAEVTGNPIGTWSSLPGSGKQRKLSGYPSGTQLWVHFAQVRWGLQSAWSTPVLVTIP